VFVHVSMFGEKFNKEKENKH